MHTAAAVDRDRIAAGGRHVEGVGVVPVVSHDHAVPARPERGVRAVRRIEAAARTRTCEHGIGCR